MSAPASSSVLETIVAAARRRVEVSRDRKSFADLERSLAARTGRTPGDPRGTPGPGFLPSLRQPGVRVIAECKRRSPSRGVLRRDYDPVVIAGSYRGAGAAAISVLTEPGFFDGHLDHLKAVHAAYPDLPLLRKDFVVDEYQIAEAVLAGASAVLLIVAALEQEALTRLLAYAGQVEVDVLTEVHDEDEARRAIDAGAVIVGVNNRNLKTLAVSLETSFRVAPLIASATVRVAESGLRSGDDIAALAQAGYGAFLIGERFMTDDDPGAGLAAVIGDAARALESSR